MLRLFTLICLYAVAFALIGTALWLGGSAASRGTLPHLWLWIALSIGGAFLIRALQLTRRFGDPGAWRRPRHTPLSLAIAVAGYACIGIAALIGGKTAFGTVVVVLGGVLLIVSELGKRAGD
ncbi:MAG: hypothetical protein ACOY82_11605 [Pseudomonadota bacterium]